MISFRQKNNISEDAKPHKRNCVYCGRIYETISGRLCCRDCVKLPYEELDRIFDKRVEDLLKCGNRFTEKK
jgi:hypothetical protein